MTRKKRGFDRWIEIFYGGRQFDSQGREHNGDQLIQRALSTFNPKVHTPPVVIGHPQDNKPAYGWVKGLRKNLKNGLVVLEARLGQIAPEFEAAVRQGFYKKRSASFYPDGRLRHVGFLGAAPPAVKGLRDLSFENRPNEATFEFQNPPGQNFPPEREINPKANQGEEQMTELNDSKGILEILRSLFRAAREAGWTPPTEVPDGPKTNPEQILTKEETEKKTNTEVEEKEAELARAQAELQEEKEKLAREKQENKIKTLVETKVKEGVIPPAFVEMGLKEFLQAINQAGEIQFSDGKQNPVETFMSFMGQARDLGLFSEIATRHRINPDLRQIEEDFRMGDLIASRATNL